jgi:hypothetical protein
MMLFLCQLTLRNIRQKFRPGLLINTILILLIILYKCNTTNNINRCSVITFNGMLLNFASASVITDLIGNKLGIDALYNFIPYSHCYSIMFSFMPAVAERLRRAYPAPLGRAGVGSIPANPDAQKRAFFPPLTI